MRRPSWRFVVAVLALAAGGALCATSAPAADPEDEQSVAPQVGKQGEGRVLTGTGAGQGEEDTAPVGADDEDGGSRGKGATTPTTTASGEAPNAQLFYWKVYGEDAERCGISTTTNRGKFHIATRWPSELHDKYGIGTGGGSYAKVNHSPDLLMKFRNLQGGGNGLYCARPTYDLCGVESSSLPGGTYVGLYAGGFNHGKLRAFIVLPSPAKSYKDIPICSASGKTSDVCVHIIPDWFPPTYDHP